MKRNIPQHENIVSFVGLCLIPPCIVTEFVSGGSLLNILKRKILKQKQEINICHGICCGMTHLHSLNVIHRDLASRNILLTDDMIPKITDFGLSRQLSEDSKSGKTYSDEGFPLKWMSPESIKSRTYSTKSDVWSFGILMIEILLNGEEPYPDLAAFEVASTVSKGTRPTIPEGNNTLIQMIDKCTQINPLQRPEFIEMKSYFE